MSLIPEHSNETLALVKFPLKTNKTKKQREKENDGDGARERERQLLGAFRPKTKNRF